MTIHLATVMPAGILVVFQFVPIVRYKAIMVHRLNGWLVTLLLLVANAGAFMIADKSFGGKYGKSKPESHRGTLKPAAADVRLSKEIKCTIS